MQLIYEQDYFVNQSKQ